MNVYRNLSVDTTGALIKTGRANVYGWYISNVAAAVRFVKLYNKATIATGADTPVMTIQMPASSAANVATGTEASLDAFPLGLAIRASNLVADADATNPTANDVIVNLFYN